MSSNRLWLASAGDIGDAPAVPFYAGWTDTEGAQILPLLASHGRTARTPLVKSTPAVIYPPPVTVLMAQFISAPFKANTVDLGKGFHYMVTRIQSEHTCDPDNPLWNGQFYRHVGISRIVDSTGAIIRSSTFGSYLNGDLITPHWTISGWITDAPRGEVAGVTANNLGIPYPYNISDGDRFVIEVGFYPYKSAGHESDAVLESDVTLYIGDDAVRDIPSSATYHVTPDANGWASYSGSPLMFGVKSGAGPKYQKPRSPTRYGLHMQHPVLPVTGGQYGVEVLG